MLFRDLVTRQLNLEITVVYDSQHIDITKSGPTYSHIFTQPGDYLVGLMVVDEEGNPSTPAIMSLSLK